MSWTVPQGCYYGCLYGPSWDANQVHYYGAGSSVPDSEALESNSFGMLIDFRNNYIYTRWFGSTITINSNNTFTLSNNQISSTTSVCIIGSEKGLEHMRLTIVGNFSFGDGTGLLSKSALKLSNTKYSGYLAFRDRNDITIARFADGLNEATHMYNGCPLESVEQIPNTVTSLSSTFANTPLIEAPAIPSSVVYMSSCFLNCSSLISPPDLSNATALTSMYCCFKGCTSLATAPSIPSTVTDMEQCFYDCQSLTTPPIIPNGVKKLNLTFCKCYRLTSAPIIPSSVTNMSSCFGYCTSLNQPITIPSSVTDMRYCFYSCTSLNSLITINSNGSYNDIFRETSKVIPITGVSNKLQSIASSYDNVYVYSLQCTNIVAERDDDTPTNVELEIVVSRFIADGGEIDIDVYTDNIPVDNLVWNPSSLIMDNLTKKFTTTLIVDESSSHEISVQIRDVWGESSVRTVSVSTVYYTIDFLHGGKGVSFGEKAIADDLYFPLQGVTPFEADKYYSRGASSSGEHKFDKIHTKPDKWDEEPENYYALENPGGLFKNDMNSLFKRKLDLYEDGSPDGERRGYVDSILTEMLETRGWNDCISYVDGSGMISTLHVREILKNLLDMSLVGEIKAYAGTNIPRGWLDCDGRLVNISDYPYLFSVLGNTWGTPTATQFYLPDLRGRTLIGSQSGTYNVGGTGGSPYIQAHTHGFTNPTIPNHTHTLTGNWSDGTGSASAYTYHTGRKAATRATRNDGGGGQTSGGAVGGVNNVSTGTSGNYPPYKVVRYIIKY